MKMETVIRSPQKGVVAKLAHEEGVRISWYNKLWEILLIYAQDICKAGTVLVLFEEVCYSLASFHKSLLTNL